MASCDRGAKNRRLELPISDKNSQKKTLLPCLLKEEKKHEEKCTYQSLAVSQTFPHEALHYF